MNNDFNVDDGFNSNADEKKRASQPVLSTSGAGAFPPTRTAVGAADSDSYNYRVGEELECLVLFTRPGGYEILILKDGVEGFLRSKREREVGSVFTAQFLCWQDKQTD